MRAHHRIVLLTDGHSTPFLAKTAISLLRYRGSDIAAVLDRQADCQNAAKLFSVGGDTPVVGSVTEIADADALYIGIAPPGGRMPSEWRALILEALERGVDVVSGLHEFLIDDVQYVDAAEQSGAALIDVRRNRHRSTATAWKPIAGNVRIHAVGHDCSVGKMVAMLELQRGLAAAGQDAEFLATGQTGIMISGRGVPVDCVVADFVNGAAEQLVVDHANHDFLLIEGQGSISHPAFSAVTAGLLHGCAPDGLLFCYEAGRTKVKGLTDSMIPDMKQQLEVCLSFANLRHPCRAIGVAVNTRQLTEDQVDKELRWAEDTFGLPACDVYRTGVDRLVEASLSLRREIVSQ
ncbi:DUF1611 domain-containing protein [Roseiconus nitratireducens]|uniref:DUF1611 domain-containing protein n=2 Tax=Roseiconus nitratireducens TaxID=2605748 RepID=A0A5M6D241_9BACT|nr:DUF1611 domain-containing protein [Roseiconus nitratireducens]